MTSKDTKRILKPFFRKDHFCMFLFEEEFVPLLQQATGRRWGCFGLKTIRFVSLTWAQLLLLLWILNERFPDIKKLKATPWTLHGVDTDTKTPGPCLNTFDVPEFARRLTQTTELFGFLQDLSSSQLLWLTASAGHSLMHLYRTSFSVSAEQFIRGLIPAEDFPEFANLVQNMFHISSDLDECVTPIICCAVREGENGSGSTVNMEPSLLFSRWWGYRLTETTWAGGS